jgi:hypothetical protein
MESFHILGDKPVIDHGRGNIDNAPDHDCRNSSLTNPLLQMIGSKEREHFAKGRSNQRLTIGSTL